MKRETGPLPGRSKLSTADAKSPSKHKKNGMRSRKCWRRLGRNNEYSNQSGLDISDGGENDPCNNVCGWWSSHKAYSADWTTLRYRHSSLYLQTSQSKGLVLVGALSATVGLQNFLWTSFVSAVVHFSGKL